MAKDKIRYISFFYVWSSLKKYSYEILNQTDIITLVAYSTELLLKAFAAPQVCLLKVDLKPSIF